MACVIVDYGSGNLRSAAKALERAARAGGRDDAILVTGDPETVAKADRLVLPGVGAFGDCLAGLEAVPGLHEAIDEVARVRARPFLGICVGMQLMAERGLEHGVHPGFGWIGGEVRALEPADPQLKVPQIGWNELILGEQADHPLLGGLPKAAHVYFVHSYHLVASRGDDVLARADYGGPIVAMVGRDNLAGTQFHPEKSQSAGLTILGNFLTWRP
jgi:glutamine amidotransferase